MDFARLAAALRDTAHQLEVVADANIILLESLSKAVESLAPQDGEPGGRENNPPTGYIIQYHPNLSTDKLREEIAQRLRHR